jgi:type IV pilus assembly protein PilM
MGDNMTLIKGLSDYFALDIGTNAIRVVQLIPSGSDSWNLQCFGYARIEEKLTAGNSAEAMNRLGEAILAVVSQSGIKTNNIVIGLPSTKTFTTIIDVPMMSEAELKSTMKYQFDQYIPMSIDEAKVDWALLGQSLHDSSQQEVLLASVANDYAEGRLEFIEGLGFNVVAAEPDPMAITRSLLPAGIKDSRMIIDVGDRSTDLVVTYNDNPRLVRSIPTGLMTLVKAAAQNLNVQEDQARQFILKFGLATDRLEGQVYNALESTLEGFAAELGKSVKFFQTRYPNIQVSGILLSGFAAVIPQFGDYVSTKTGIPSGIANPWQRVRVGQSDQRQLAPVASEFAAVVGLAQRSNK